MYGTSEEGRRTVLALQLHCTFQVLWLRGSNLRPPLETAHARAVGGARQLSFSHACQTTTLRAQALPEAASIVSARTHLSSLRRRRLPIRIRIRQWRIKFCPHLSAHVPC
jgi:hypothetical protein